MPAAQEREGSVSGGFDDSDRESHFDRDSQPPPAKPGRKKNANSQAARRDQNRIAQREFRLRKQQRIRDLEARVEILSGGKDEALSEIRNILKDLMEENQTLRNLLRSIGAFIGEGAGGFLPRIGWTLTDFNNFINKSETDTAWESYQRRKKSSANPSPPTTSMAPKRSAEDDSTNASRSKRSRGQGEQDDELEGSQDGFNSLAPINLSAPHLPMYPSSARPPQDSGLFTDLLKGSTGSPMFARSPASTNTSNQYSGPSSSNVASYSPYVPPINMNVEPSLPFSSTNTHGSMQQRMTQISQPQDSVDDDDDDDPNIIEALKLVSYHLDNYKRNNAYCLPSSLRTTLVQRTVPHENVIDRIPHPELRDRMILLRGRFDLADCLMDFRHSITLHGDDVLAHANWEISEKWLRQYGFLIDQSTLNITNRWRRERGEPELRLADLVPADHPPGPA